MCATRALPSSQASMFLPIPICMLWAKTLTNVPTDRARSPTLANTCYYCPSPNSTNNALNINILFMSSSSPYNYAICFIQYCFERFHEVKSVYLVLICVEWNMVSSKWSIFNDGIASCDQLTWSNAFCWDLCGALQTELHLAYNPFESWKVLEAHFCNGIGVKITCGLFGIEIGKRMCLIW